MTVKNDLYKIKCPYIMRKLFWQGIFWEFERTVIWETKAIRNHGTDRVSISLNLRYLIYKTDPLGSIISLIPSLSQAGV